MSRFFSLPFVSLLVFVFFPSAVHSQYTRTASLSCSISGSSSNKTSFSVAGRCFLNGNKFNITCTASDGLSDSRYITLPGTAIANSIQRDFTCSGQRCRTYCTHADGCWYECVSLAINNNYSNSTGCQALTDYTYGTFITANGSVSGSCTVDYVSSVPCSEASTMLDSIACNIPKGNPDYCATTQPAAQALLAATQAKCDSLGGEFEGNVVHEDNGDYCVKETCNLYSNCLADNPAPPVQRRIVLEKKFESELKEESTYNYSQQYKLQPFYDALGRRTEPRPETRRHLFEKRSKAVVRGMEPDMGTILRREEPAGQCCVESFDVRLRGNIDDPIIILYDKIGIEVEFDSEFHGEEHNSGCNPSCCEFKQESKGYIFKNDEYKTETTCKVNGEYVDLDSTVYKQDCYGRNCEHFDNREGYDDILGIYEGTDSPGLRVKNGDTVDIRMEFNSYIKDKCNAYEIKSSKYWGFHLYGTVPDDLNRTLFGVINQ
jgi:hypothetical protein